ncbi:MAG: hypothetical protein JJ975_09440 [Bacteroidia bacterium]|nr:hypothetical protein [Bacteroidia bacterium]
MNAFLTQLKWQFVLLHKNNIIRISLGVTMVYGVLLFFLRNVGSLDELLVALVLNDPSIIGYFFIGIAIYTEIKHQILPAVLVTPVNVHQLLISRVTALACIGVICSLGLAISVKGFNFDILSFTAGALSICILSALLGIIMLTYASEFLKFTMLSVPIFLVFINLPLLQYLGVVDLGMVKYFLPIQGSLDLIDFSVRGTEINLMLSYLTIVVFIPVFYLLALRRFSKKLVSKEV